MKVKTNSKFFEKNIAKFVFCSFFPTGLEDYVNFFKEKFDNFVYIKFKFPHSRDPKAYSVIQIYSHGKLKNTKRLFSFSLVNRKLFYFLFLPINYLIYFLEAIFSLNFFPSNEKKGKVVFMGINYFCAFCGIILKRLGKVDFVIYRVMDFFPLPASGPYCLLNRIFYILDEFCLRNADSIWFTTEGHIIGREKYGYFDRGKYHYQMIPLGLDIEKFFSSPLKERKQNSLVYCGVVSKYYLLDLIFEALKDLGKEFNELRFHIIGSGPDLDYYKDLACKKGLEDVVFFHGFMEESREFRNIMESSLLGIALYKDEENFIKYTEPAKVKYYLSFGVPSIVSKVPEIAKELDRRKVCFAVNNNESEITRKISEYFSNRAMQVKYINNINNFVKEIDIRELLERTLIKTFNYEKNN